MIRVKVSYQDGLDIRGSYAVLREFSRNVPVPKPSVIEHAVNPESENLARHFPVGVILGQLFGSCVDEEFRLALALNVDEGDDFCGSCLDREAGNEQSSYEL